ncbi:CvpA family protein [Fusobacterium sp. MFO224]|uniref:CvpA family protein n=1 Tax=Fusobacterium sp. MFO224 TaxID=3378070 RepID=UPI003852FE9A
MYLDVAILVIVSLAFIFGIKNGFIVEFMSTFGVVINFIITQKIAPIVIKIAKSYVGEYSYNYVYGITFVVIFMFFSLVIHLLNSFLKRQRISLLSRISGGILSLIKGVLIGFLVILIYNIVLDSFPKISDFGKDSKVNEYFIENSDKINDYIPEIFKEKLMELRDGRLIDKYIDKLF